MFKMIPVLDAREVAELRKFAASAPFVDGRISNPHNKAKQNEQLHDAAAYQASSKILLQGLMRSEDFRNFAMPVMAAPPMMTRYTPGMRYGAHADAAFIQLPGATIRSDLSCTIFLNDPKDYEGGELHIRIGDGELKFKLQPGEAIVYPSDTLRTVARGPLLGRYSKALEYEYSPALRRDLLAQTGREHGAAIGEALGWLASAARGAPLLEAALNRAS